MKFLHAACVSAAAIAPACGVFAAHRPVGIDDLVTMRWPDSVQISPDGKWVAYEVISPDLKNNTYWLDLFVVAADGSGAARRMGASLPGRKFGNPGKPVWMPNSKGLIHVTGRDEGRLLRWIDVASGEEKPFLDAAELGEHSSLNADTVRFSPDGRLLAFVVSETKVAPPTPKIFHALEIDDPRWTAKPQPSLARRRVWMFDVAEKHARPVTDESLNASDFSWSPDGRWLALEATRSFGDGSYMRGDIYITDANGRNLRGLVVQPGNDGRPTWSPDGKRIAFATQRGRENWMRANTVSVVDADGKSAPRDIGQMLDSITGSEISPPQWATDGESVDVLTGYRMSRHLFRVSVRDGRTLRLTPREERHYGGYGDWFSYSRDGKWMAGVVQEVGVPPEVYVSRSDGEQPRRLTRLNPEWDELTVPSSQVVEWRSRDGKWTIRGLLLKPSGFRKGQRYPLLVDNVGGPGMVNQLANPSYNYPLLAQAEMGYVILVPNTRGRGGYGRDFREGLGRDRTYVLESARDVVAGAELLVELGIADPEAMGVFGFSYGEALTLQVLVESDRFSAASVGDGFPNLLAFFHGHDILPGVGDQLPLYRDMFGIANWFDPEEIQRIYRQTHTFFLDRVKTPVLIETGELSAWPPNQQLLAGLQHFGIPAEHNVYPRSTHGWEEPLLIQDSYRRLVSWFDYWLRGKPYRDANRQKNYDVWKAKRAAKVDD